MNKVYVGDTGTLIKLDTGVSLVGATALSIMVKKPGGATLTWTATASGNHLVYTTLAGDLNIPGTWKLQASITLPSGKWTGETALLQIFPLYG